MKSPDRMVSSCHTDAMVSSCHGLLSDDHEQNVIMTQSLDPNMLSGTLSTKTSNNSLQDMEGKIYNPLNNVETNYNEKHSPNRNLESVASGYETSTSTGIFNESRFSPTVWPFADFTKDAHAE